MKVFTELDLVNAYHQIKLTEESRKYTGFYFLGEGQFVWNVLFFGAKGAVTHFQRVMEEALVGVPDWVVVVIYVDNILVASRRIETHVEDVKLVIKALNKANLRLKPSKCKIAMAAIQFMGIIVDGGRRGVDVFKAKVFEDMKALTSGKDVQAVLGFLNFLRDFIPLYACVAAPLEALRNTKKISMKLWVESGAKEAFEKLKKILSSAPILAPVRFWTTKSGPTHAVFFFFLLLLTLQQHLFAFLFISFAFLFAFLFLLFSLLFPFVPFVPFVSLLLHHLFSLHRLSPCTQIVYPLAT